MDGKLELLAEKVEKVLDLLERLKKENVSLRRENKKLKAEFADIQKEYRLLKLGDADQSEVVRNKLTLVLGRLEELECLYQ